jgi:hypothetical protein
MYLQDLDVLVLAEESVIAIVSNLGGADHEHWCRTVLLPLRRRTSQLCWQPGAASLAVQALLLALLGLAHSRLGTLIGLAHYS